MKRVKQLMSLSHEHYQGLVLAQKALRLKSTAQGRDIQQAWQGLASCFQGPARSIFLLKNTICLSRFHA